MYALRQLDLTVISHAFPCFFTIPDRLIYPICHANIVLLSREAGLSVPALVLLGTDPVCNVVVVNQLVEEVSIPLFLDNLFKIHLAALRNVRLSADPELAALPGHIRLLNQWSHVLHVRTHRCAVTEGSSANDDLATWSGALAREVRTRLFLLEIL